MSEVSEKLRNEFGEGDAKRDAGLRTPDDIDRVDNIQYGPDPVWNVLDVYRPKGERRKLPVIVIVHGGGWVYGDKSVYQFYGMSLAQRRFVVVNFTYRLAPEAKYPAPLEDTNQVVTWIHDNQDAYLFKKLHSWVNFSFLWKVWQDIRFQLLVFFEYRVKFRYHIQSNSFYVLFDKIMVIPIPFQVA